MIDDKYKYTVKDRFLKYVTFDTQSDENSESYPSTDGQWLLLRYLEKELRGLGLSEVELDQHGYLTASLPSNLDHEAPTIGFFAHVDTSFSVPGSGVKPMIHKNYQGQGINLPADESQIISLQTNPELAEMLGHDLITSDGSTLLGADDKCGVAEIMDVLNYLNHYPEFPHGQIKVCFNPDEEVGLGTKYFDVGMFGADFGYTLDGPDFGVLEVENFNAAGLEVTFIGRNFHPGYAKDKMINSVKVAADFVASLPEGSSPENTEGRQGYIHPMEFEGNEEKSKVKVILRDFEMLELEKKRLLVENLANQSVSKFPGSRVEIDYSETYLNMKYVLQKHPQAEILARQAYRALGVEPKLELIRGGTDGVMLAQKGLPCPNLSSGQHNQHSKTEFTSVQEMQSAVKLILQIVQESANLGKFDSFFSQIK